MTALPDVCKNVRRLMFLPRRFVRFDPNIKPRGLSAYQHPFARQPHPEMSEMGQKGDLMGPKYDFRLAPTSVLNLDIGPCQKHAAFKESC